MRTRPARAVLAPVIPPFHLALFRVSRGYLELSRPMVPSLILTTFGAKSGLERRTPLMCVPESATTYLVGGSNFGRPAHPGWTINLLANPRATIVVRRRRITVTATLLSGAEREAAWLLFDAQWPDYRDYETTSGREVRIFRLTEDSAKHA
jgi:deazaflavin-dependent oxidoreductase (nitroreductase family)